MKPKILLATTLLYVIVVTIVSLMPVEQVSTSVWLDKVVHLGMYAILFLGLRISLPKLTTPVLATAIISYGWVIEFVQEISPYRTFDVADGVANMLGVGLAWLLYHLLTPRERI